MGFFAKLFAKPPEPQPSVTDDVLGKMTWSGEEEAWLGNYNGVDYQIDYDGQKIPNELVVTYAREILNDAGWLTSTLAEAKSDYKHKMNEKLRTFYNDEIDQLAWGVISFGLRKGKRIIVASLKGGREDRAWRIEYVGRTCEGIGFDS